jgi:hypothetical protein
VTDKAFCLPSDIPFREVLESDRMEETKSTVFFEMPMQKASATFFGQQSAK